MTDRPDRFALDERQNWKGAVGFRGGELKYLMMSVHMSMKFNEGYE